MKTIILFLLTVLVAFSISCRTRLRPKLYIINETLKQPLDLKQSYYLNNFSLKTTPGGSPLVSGSANVLVSNQSMTNPGDDIIETGLIKAVKEISYRLYVELPADIKVDSLNIMDKSICRIIGNYEVENQIKHYVCREGYLAIDTVKSSRFFARMYGKYFNSANDSLIFEGTLNVKQKSSSSRYFLKHQSS